MTTQISSWIAALSCLLCCVLSVAGAPPAAGADLRIVPGERAGAITLGMSRVSAGRVLGSPARTRRLPGGIVTETWLNHQPLPSRAALIRSAKQLKCDYETVFFQNDRAIQIEVSSAAFQIPGGLTTENKASAFEKRFRPYESFRYTWKATDPGMSSPACKHLLWYGDDVAAGLAWKQGGWGCLAPDAHPEPEAVIVHRRGARAMPNPDDADDYSGTGGRTRRPVGAGHLMRG